MHFISIKPVFNDPCLMWPYFSFPLEGDMRKTWLFDPFYFELLILIMKSLIDIKRTNFFFTVHLHNEFLLAIISRCQSLSSSLGKVFVPFRRWLYWRFDGRKLSLLAAPVNGYLRPWNRQLMPWNFQMLYSYLHSNVIMCIDVYCNIIDKMT